MSISLQSSFVYGPIKSRRLGNSLGINILPQETKFCLSNCLYCQYGATNLRSVRLVKLPPLEKIQESLSTAFPVLADKQTKIDTITFSGNGEPTLHPELELILKFVKGLRDRYFPNAKIGILSDSSRVHLEPIRKILELFDERYMKLDSGDPEIYQKINQPLGSVRWDEMIRGLKKISTLTLQSLFISSPVDNSTGIHFESWLNVVQEIRPEAVHLYTLDRAPADSRVRSVPTTRLMEIADLLSKKIDAKIAYFENKHDSSGMNF